MLVLMSNTINQASVPAGWLESFARNKTQIAAGEGIPLLPILDPLRATAERLEAEQGLSADGMKLTIER